MPQPAEQNRESCHRWREKNRESERARVRAWRQANPEKAGAQRRRWAEANPEKLREAYRQGCARRKARKLEAFVEDVDRAVVLAQNQGLCGVCWEPVEPKDFHVDHIIPLCQGGEHSYENTQPTHPICNQRKGRDVHAP